MQSILPGLGGQVIVGAVGVQVFQDEQLACLRGVVICSEAAVVLVVYSLVELVFDKILDDQVLAILRCYLQRIVSLLVSHILQVVIRTVGLVRRLVEEIKDFQAIVHSYEVEHVPALDVDLLKHAITVLHNQLGHCLVSKNNSESQGKQLIETHLHIDFT